MQYIIKNNKSNSYFNKEIKSNIFHWVLDTKEAHVFDKKVDARKLFNKMKNKREFESFEIMGGNYD